MINLKSLLLIAIVLFTQNVLAKRECLDPDKFPVCHAGSSINPNYVNICVDFASLWGHFANHENDYYGECKNADADIVAYTCNAGLSFSPATKKICQDNATGLSVSTCDNLKNCTCSNNPALESQYQSNYFTAHMASFFAGEQFYYDEFDFENLAFNEIFTLGEYGRVTEAAQELGKYVLSPNNKLKFHFGSERFGAKYFVDTCVRYVGDLPAGDKILIGHQSVILSENASTYRQKADLKYKYELFCDHSTTTSVDFSVSTSPVSSTVILPFNSAGLVWQQNIPAKKFCFIRTTFFENANADYLRPQKLQNVEFQNSTLLTLDSSSTSSEDLPVNVCYVENSSGCCRDVLINTENQFRDFILSVGNTGHRNSSFRGICPSGCKRFCN